MSDYSKAIIYVIECSTTGNIYIGSTIQDMMLRMSKHETDFKGYYGYNTKFRAYRSSFDCMEHDTYNIYKVEDYPCDNVLELEQREALHILKAREDGLLCTNKQIPRRIKNPDYQNLPDLFSHRPSVELIHHDP